MIVDVTPAVPAKAEKPEARVGAILCGRYRLGRVLGTGGMGSVYEATHLTTEKKVAVKLLAGQLSRDLKLVARFRREAVAMARLRHRCIVSLLDFGEDAGEREAHAFGVERLQIAGEETVRLHLRLCEPLAA